MKAKMPVTLGWGVAHLYEAGADGAFAITRLNIPLTVDQDEDAAKAPAP